MDLKIRVENVGYYQCDRDLSATSISQLKELNGFADYVKHSVRRLPACKLNVKVPNPESKELQMESTLDYLSQMSPEFQKPDFVATKDLLKSVTSLQTHLIHVCKVGGVIYLLKMDEKDQGRSEEIFHHFMTRKSENEPIPVNSEQRGVWKAEIFDVENPRKRNFTILYSGKVDGVTKTAKGNWRHYEMGVAFGGIETDSFWWNQSCSLFWKAVFGGSPSVIVGARTGDSVYKKTFRKEDEKIAVTYPKNSVYEIKELSRNEMPTLAVSANNRPLWTVADGKNLHILTPILCQLKELNGFADYVKHSVRRLPACKLNVKVPNPESKELQMESTLDYLSQMSPEFQKPDFVATKDLLKSVTSLQTHLVHVCKVGGVIYLLKMDEKDQGRSEEIFHHFMTRKSENEPIPVNSEQRGVWKAEIFDVENPRKRIFRILYSRKVDGVTKTAKGNWRHYEMGVAFGGIETDSFWWNQSCPLFWKAVFGGSPSVIVGARTGDSVYKKTFRNMGNEDEKIVVTYPKNSVYEIKELSRDEIPSLAVSANNRPLWTVADGKKNLFEFLKLVKSHAKKDGDCFVVSRMPGSQKWIFRQDFVAVRTFRETIQRAPSRFIN